MSQENVDAVRSFYEASERGDLRAGADLYDPLVLFLPVAGWPTAAYYIGTEGMSEWNRELLGTMNEYTLTADEFIDAGDSVVVAARSHGVGKESGIPTDLPHFTVWTFRGRTVIRIETFRDRAEALEAVGLGE